ncbi:hypothetical protein HO572_01180 [Streptococcus suis]|uniref:hypothetical protein n=1 Tax=Streptococcus suis TaxID=1307 RepID=UPI0009426F55|nr:hypothetical protein [Streptococcus suis]AUW26651.1 hypothetical protein CR542_09270 [Streptococcus suis]MBM6460328.1 hypothetical protein [Streptococcus suis]MBM7286653.1 hypothetical protein [Streptococcus suis]MBO8112139.1 hypothetical protein [Streptococcus suis]MBS0719808.1 hypothetical protein [Streptococcus suis]
MIELTFKGNSLAEVFESMKAALAGERVAEKAVSESVQQTEVVEEVVEAKPSVTLAEIQSLTKAKLEEKKSGAIKKLLGEFGVSKVGQVAEEDYASFYERLGEL